MEAQLYDLNKAGMFRGVPTSTAALKQAEDTLSDIDALLAEVEE